ncbi:hypothetical protein RRG08_041610 [Elysia crispata]|uniref:Uncharacterized protein n=1 Tax=Elysia crispata TaxID=231223 RepID=A0AAE0Z512_9GAST|nr:hypothetical protein RRG08_041610 [Elysia crispata]
MKKKVTHIYNESVKCKKWYNEDIQRVHRLGRPVNNKPRPIIVRFLLFEDKLIVLKSRTDLKIINLGVSNDLTIKQRQELKKLRESGKRGYYTNGRLVMEPVPTESTGTSRVMVAS